VSDGSNPLFYAVAYGNSTTALPGFVALIRDSFKVIRSTNGSTWTSHTADAPNPKPWQAVAFGNGVFVAVAATTDYYSVMRSPDGGISWTTHYDGGYV